ncbi:hypothetical protein [Phaeobacter inhibens]|uniref:hypothetical protein n=1 Tax=Phaeobacter inhibens TaxID=221822 RepID=UPI0024B65DBB|nr:hypothetical protein [Phaeobacter inhibens]WHP70250.1 hypothetical protein QMZ01_08790 [Phaeobacter inhibens]
MMIASSLHAGQASVSLPVEAKKCLVLPFDTGFETDSTKGGTLAFPYLSSSTKINYVDVGSGEWFTPLIDLRQACEAYAEIKTSKDATHPQHDLLALIAGGKPLAVIYAEIASQEYSLGFKFKSITSLITANSLLISNIESCESNPTSHHESFISHCGSDEVDSFSGVVGDVTERIISGIEKDLNGDEKVKEAITHLIDVKNHLSIKVEKITAAEE